ncbi:MAG: hypothetical protein ABSE70_03770 [Candidatus Limnocylindrales bacterium]
MDEVDPDPIADDRRWFVQAEVGNDPELQQLIADGDDGGDRCEDDPRRKPPPTRRVFNAGAALRICGVRIGLVQ